MIAAFPPRVAFTSVIQLSGQWQKGENYRIVSLSPDVNMGSFKEFGGFKRLLSNPPQSSFPHFFENVCRFLPARLNWVKM